jgi:hypothetical protein
MAVPGQQAKFRPATKVHSLHHLHLQSLSPPPKSMDGPLCTSLRAESPITGPGAPAKPVPAPAARPPCPDSLTRPTPGGHRHDHEGSGTAGSTRSFAIMDGACLRVEPPRTTRRRACAGRKTTCSAVWSKSPPRQGRISSRWWCGPPMSGLGPDSSVLGPRGAVAQLVAHLHGMEGVRGSNPLSSTEEIAGQRLTYSSHPTRRMGAVAVLGGIWEIVFSRAGPVRKGASRVSRSGTLECGSMAARSRRDSSHRA